jgi:hypothetical protein
MNSVPRLRIPAGVLLLVAMAVPPVFAEVDLAGDWGVVPGEREGNPELGNYLGLPINDAARVFADTWESSRLSELERQCMPHALPSISRAPFPMRVSMERDPETHQVVAVRFFFKFMEQTQTVWMDGRPHPSELALHTWMGFSTGTWEGDTLVVTTTHIKKGYLRRDGVPVSDQATMIEHWMRHGSYLSHTTFIIDPVYLTEPLMRGDTYLQDPEMQGDWLYPCEESADEVAEYKRGNVPNFPIGQNPFLKEFSTRHKVPYDATRGGAETMYPDYQVKLKTLTSNSTGAK